MVNGNALLSSINDLIGLDASLLYSNDEKLSFAKRLVRELQDNEVVDGDCVDKAPRKSTNYHEAKHKITNSRLG